LFFPDAPSLAAPAPAAKPRAQHGGRTKPKGVRGRFGHGDRGVGEREIIERDRVEQGDYGPLVDCVPLGRDAELSIPTPEHYLPLLYVLGASTREDAVDFPASGMDGGSISMLSIRLG